MRYFWARDVFRREIFSGESLLQARKSPWELMFTKPVPEIFEFVPLIGQKNISIANQ